MMTVTAIMAGLLPILWGNGTGASVMKRIAAPMVGGMISSTVLTLIVIPAVYSVWKERPLHAVVPTDSEGLAHAAPPASTTGPTTRL
jgi:Cu(I)/Ag(I) efflux system membrane protein CusA/SilA